MIEEKEKDKDIIMIEEKEIDIIMKEEENLIIILIINILKKEIKLF